MTSLIFVIHHKISKAQNTTCIFFMLRSRSENTTMSKHTFAVGGLIYLKFSEQLHLGRFRQDKAMR
jgi:hypothetical protein